MSPLQHLGTLPAREPITTGIYRGMGAGLTLRNQLQSEQEKAYQKQQYEYNEKKKTVEIMLNAYLDADEAGKAEMRASQHWNDFITMAKTFPEFSIRIKEIEPEHQVFDVNYKRERRLAEQRGAPLPTVGKPTYDIIGPAEKEAEPPKSTIAKPGEVVGHWDVSIQEFVPDYQVAVEKKSETLSPGQVIVDKDESGNWIEKYKAPFAPEAEKLYTLKLGDKLFDKSGVEKASVPGQDIILRPGESIVDKDGTIIKTAPMSEYQESLVKKGKEEIEIKWAGLGIEIKELAAKVNATEQANEIDKILASIKQTDSDSLVAWRDAQTAQGAEKIVLMNKTLEAEINKFNTTHQYNITQDIFYNNLATKVDNRAEKQLALTERVAVWDKAKNDAQFALNQLKEKHQNILGWAELADAKERTTLLQQAADVKSVMDKYEKELKQIEIKANNAKLALTKAQTVKVKAETEKIKTEPTQTKNIFQNLISKALTDIVKTYPKGFLDTLGQEQQSEYSRIIMKKAYPLFVSFLQAEPGLSDEDKNYYNNLAQKIMVSGESNFNVPREQDLTPTDVNEGITGFFRNLFSGGKDRTKEIRKDVNDYISEYGMSATREQVNAYLKQRGYSDSEINGFYGG